MQHELSAGRTRTTIMVCCLALLPAIAGAQGGITGEKQGQGGSVVKGAAGTNGGVGDNGLQHCDKPMGAMAVVEPQNQILVGLRRYNLESPSGLIRMMIQQSNCFIVVERGVGMNNMMQERALAANGEARSGSNMGKGQMVAADFVMTPSVVFSENNAGGVGGAVGGLLGPKAAAVAGGLKFKEAQTSMLVSDSRSGVQVAAAFMDNYNKVVGVVRGDPSLQRSVGTLSQEAAAGGQKKSGMALNEGDVLLPKIANVKMLADPSDSAKVVATLGRTDELVVVGAEKDGYINVQSSAASGWVRTALVNKR